MHYINYNGNIVTAKDITIETSNRAFRYGDSLFETIRVMVGRICFGSYHAERLRNGMKILSYNNFSTFTDTFLEDQILKLAKSCKADNARVRFTVFRDGAGFFTPHSNNGLFLIELEPLREYEYCFEKASNGCRVGIFTDIPKDYNLLSPLKTGNNLTYIAASIYKQKMGLDDILLVNSKGNLVEAATANIFIIKDGVYYTPPITDGCVAGVMRRAILQLADMDLVIKEKSLTPQDLNTADEVFLTNAIKGVTGVTGYRNKRYFNSSIRNIIKMLNDLVKYEQDGFDYEFTL